MAIRRKRLEYDVYPASYQLGQAFYMNLRTFGKAKRQAKSFGPGSQIWRSVQETNKRGLPLGDWWDLRLFLWTGREFKKIARSDWERYAHVDCTTRSRRG